MARELAIVVGGALIASTLLRMFLVQVFIIPSPSMEQTLLIDDRVAVQKVVPLARGDIVVFRDDNEWLGIAEEPQANPLEAALTFVGVLPDRRSNHLIKRAIGLPGDHVICCDSRGRVSVNGHALAETSYLYADDLGQVLPSDHTFDVVVPAGRVFVMGDHRDQSADSRCHLDEEANGVRGAPAFVPLSSIVGTAVAVPLPFDRMQLIGRPATFDGVPAPVTAAPAQPVLTGDPPDC